VFNPDARRPERFPQPSLVDKENSGPAIVVGNEFQLALLSSADKLDRDNVWSTRYTVLGHEIILASTVVPSAPSACRICRIECVL
jgi:hypothetical protein